MSTTKFATPITTLKKQQTVPAGQIYLAKKTFNDCLKVTSKKSHKMIANIGRVLTKNKKHSKIYLDENIPAPICVQKTSWERNLTTECIESNPDSAAIQAPEPIFGHGIFEYCQNCTQCNKLMDYHKPVVFYRYNCKNCTPELQARMGFGPDSLYEEYKQKFGDWLYRGKHGDSFLSSFVHVPRLYENHINLIEDVGLLLYHFIRSRNHVDRCVAIVTFCKLRGSRLNIMGNLLDLAHSLFSQDYGSSFESDILNRMNFAPQSDDNIFGKLREYLGTYDKIKEMAIFKKLHKFFMYILCCGLLDGTKINFASLQFDKFEEEAMRRAHRPGIDMVIAMIDTVLFVCEAGHDYFKTGNFDKFVHNGSSYESWVKTANKLKMQSKFVNNPEPHGFNRFTFVAELKDAIEKGKSIVRFTGGFDKGEKIYLQKTLCELQMIEAEETTKRSAQQPRKDPFGILIHGSSHIAKSKLTEIMFKHYGKCFNLPIEDNYRYTRCPVDEYWSGFDSTQWCIVMDDIAFLAPNGEVDPTLKELLQVKNSVPYTPPQAALEDKGRTPVKAELLIATTNTKHLNLHAYFACPFAIARRLSYVVTPTVKEEYVKDGFMVDSKLIPPTPEGEYMNIWNFTISVPRPESSEAKDNQRTRYEVIEKFEDIESFLQWYIFVAEEHARSQAKADAAAKTMHTVEVCMGCKRSKKNCLCGSEWPHTYQKCNLCDKLISSCICNFEEQVDTSDFNLAFQTKLWFYSNIVSGRQIDLPEFLFDFVNQWLYVIVYTFMSLFYIFPFPFILFCLFLMSMYAFTYIFVVLNYVYQWKYGYLWKYRMLIGVCGSEIDTYRLLFRLAGEKVERIKISSNKLYKFGLFLALPTTVLVLRKLWNEWMKNAESEAPRIIFSEFIHCTSCFQAFGVCKLKTECEKDVDHFDTSKHCRSCFHIFGEKNLAGKCARESCQLSLTSQGNIGTIPVSIPVEKKTFYYQDPYATTPCEISGASKCAQGNQLMDRVKLNSARFHIRYPLIGINAWTTAVNFHGNLWMFNTHSIKADHGIIDIHWDDDELNVSRNISDISFDKNDVRTIPNSDVAIIELLAVPPAKSLLPYFPLDAALEGTYKGTYVLVSRSGVKSELQINNIRHSSCPYFGVDGYRGIAVTPTEVGHCGSLCIVMVGTAQVIIGSHTCGAPTGAIGMQHISQKMLQTVIETYRPQVLEGTIPISAPGYERELIELGTKSSIRFLERGTAKVYGSFKGFRPRHKSKVCPTYIAEYAIEHGYKADFGPPAMNWQPWHLAIKDMTTPIHCYYNSNIKICEDAFFNDIVTKLGNQLHMLQVYSLDVALNGADGVTYVDKLNCSTSAGNPFKKTKKAFITQELGKITDVDSVILDRVKVIEDCYDNNTRFHPQFCGHLKDEPVSLKKIAAGKTRVFTGGEFAWSIVVRKYLLSHIRLIQNNPFVFEAMPGVIAQSTEWRDLHDFITHFGKHKMVAGDYGKFDKRMAAPFILSAFNILERLAAKAGWPDEDLRYIRCIARDTAFPCIDFNGDLIEIQGNPSGHPLTVIINCLVNSLYMRYAFLLISGKPIETFQDHVHLATYGDDNIMGVSDDCPNFNHTRIAAAMKCIGVEYTMAEKEAESVPYIHIDDASFLKRSFVYDKDVGCIVAPLDESSFHKMMTARLPKDDMAAEAHAVCVIETAQREYFFHGKEVFLERQKFFHQLVKDCGLQSWVRDSTFPNYYDLVYDFWMRFDDEVNAKKYSLRE